ncbi:MAG: Dabb family protein [Phycisphaerales bacterium]|nr:Dabb family protein [Phycisphaerales bacterium]
MERLWISAIGLLCVWMSGCRAGGAEVSTSVSRPAAVSHVVFFKLRDPADGADLLADCDRRLPVIDGVVSYVSGHHLDTGRSTVESGYDAALYIGFDDVDSYRAYVDDPRHVAMVRDWRDRLEWYQVFDFSDLEP